MAVTVNWETPDTLSETATYTINVYRATNGETGDYSLLANIVAKSNNVWVTSHEDSGGLSGYYYYVKYLSGGTEGAIVLAWVTENVKELRLVTEIKNGLPRDISIFRDMSNRDIKVNLQNALHSIRIMVIH